MNTYYEITMHDPETDTTAFIVIDRLIGGIATGGLRMSPTVTLEEVRDLAEVMTYKHGLMNLPLGGAKAGIVGDPSAPDKEKKIQAFARMAEPLLKSCLLLGEDMGIYAKDVRAMYAHIQLDPLERVLNRLQERGVKYEIGQGVRAHDLLSDQNMETTAGFGLMESLLETAELIQLPLEQATAAVHGFGTVGSEIAKLLHDRGVTITAVGDAEGAIYREEGLDIHQLLSIRKPNGCIDREKIAQAVKQLTNEELLQLPVDLLIPASVSQVIHKGNAHSIRAKIIVEAANMPTTNEADEILREKGVIVLPDFMVNAGSALSFGLIITGEALPQDMWTESAKRIRRMVRTVLTQSMEQEEPTRIVALALASAHLQQMLYKERSVSELTASV
ncbi:Glu/Leu/Phe/Val dehydrogenase [Brevibacillus sp. MCWH]|jgi:glutamate dehydrogenase (NAD(P)+)|uniref:Glu/Leu/Phe/Val family dehydrogenase n=1 Tax=Brevibacillus sp. MCWH TaxID=2508871 RepID=UPI0014914F3F|nr:Glu/Leu/Phe/Val dehydrogenase [Brevibacillus sp. MCWH]NNV01684.1 Glu/Leu/Phe/Val dehydrogenase [Brevibacillus sp. MCWH]